MQSNQEPVVTFCKQLTILSPRSKHTSLAFFVSLMLLRIIPVREQIRLSWIAIRLCTCWSYSAVRKHPQRKSLKPSFRSQNYCRAIFFNCIAWRLRAYEVPRSSALEMGMHLKECRSLLSLSSLLYLVKSCKLSNMLLYLSLWSSEPQMLLKLLLWIISRCVCVKVPWTYLHKNDGILKVVSIERKTKKENQPIWCMPHTSAYRKIVNTKKSR